jgi:hypothetical protein
MVGNERMSFHVGLFIGVVVISGLMMIVVLFYLLSPKE